MSKIRQINLDVIIFGGGVAGLWLLARLRKKGYSCVLLETDALGAGQTRYAQGIIHGGTKYALTGKVSEAAHTVAAMPSRWRACLSGEGELDLTTVKVLSEFQYMWSTSNLTSRMAGFFASKLMRSRTQQVPQQDYPALFKNPKFKGQVYQLDEPVLDVSTLLQALAQAQMDQILKVEMSELEFDTGDSVKGVRVHSIATDTIFEARKLILMAGKGNQAILKKLGQHTPTMQLRPLQMVAVRGEALSSIYAHCLGASANPRITITSHTDNKGQVVWYMGGQLAEEGVGRDSEAQVEAAKKELTRLFPWLDCSACEWLCLPVDRAEVKFKDGKRPDNVFAVENNNVITAWPTKLALSPVLADKVEALLEQDNVTPSHDEISESLGAFEHPQIASLPWQEETRWN
ncbi:MAG: FAD-dependent oxidoreductase [Gammaproteobacteria bacterium]|nr:FAD-dependent oxidoreductase [Gammaproteobacteria bacterium]